MPVTSPPQGARLQAAGAMNGIVRTVDVPESVVPVSAVSPVLPVGWMLVDTGNAVVVDELGDVVGEDWTLKAHAERRRERMERLLLAQCLRWLSTLHLS